MEKAFRSILLPVDGSPQSRTSQEMAIFLCKLFNSQVTLIHVISHELMTFSGQIYTDKETLTPISTVTGQFPRTISLPKTRSNILPEEIIQEITEQYREKGEIVLSDAASLFEKEGIPTPEKFVEGNSVGEAILREANGGQYDLIILGNSGNEENESDLHLGSVAKDVSVSAKTSVLIVRKNSFVTKILAPVDGSAKDEKALEYASAIANKAKAKITLLHVQEKHLLRLHPEIEKIGIQILKNATNRIQDLGVEQKLLPGDPATTIAQTAKTGDFDLIVLGTRKQGGFRHFLLGSAADHVLHHATVSVLLAK